MARIMIIEDDTALREELASLLTQHGFTPLWTTDFDNVAHEVVQTKADCAIVDLKLPGCDFELKGHSICRDIRGVSSVPILVLTSLDSEFDEVKAMNLGADDYLTKPYRPAILIAHIQSLLRRSAAVSASDSHAHAVLSYNGVNLNLETAEVTYNGKSALLTRNEQRILALLMHNPRAVISRHEIMCDLWESDAFVDDNTLTVNVNRLRHTLTNIGVPKDFLQTKRGVGYFL